MEYSLRPDDRSQILLNEPDGSGSKADHAQIVANAETNKKFEENGKLVEASENPKASVTSQNAIDTAGQDLPDTIPLVPIEPAGQRPATPSSPVLPPPVPPSIADSPTSNWYVRPTSGGQYGPATGLVLWQWVQENRVGPDSLVWREDWKEWQTAAAAFQHRTVHENLKPPAPPPVSGSLQQTNSEISSQSDASSTAGQRARDTDSTEATTLPSLGQKNREYRRKRKQRNYLILVISLVIIFLILLIGLIVVLWRQYA